MLTCLTRAEPGSHLTGALCPRIAPSPMMTRCTVANFGNGFDEPLRRTYNIMHSLQFQAALDQGIKQAKAQHVERLTFVARG